MMLYRFCRANNIVVLILLGSQAFSSENVESVEQIKVVMLTEETPVVNNGANHTEVVGIENVAEVFEKGKVKGEIKLFSYGISNVSDEELDAYATALGGDLSYNTNTKMPVYGSIRFHTSQLVGYNVSSDATALFNNDKNGEGLTANSEAYIAWNGTDRIFKAGNLMLSTPMMNEDTTRIIPWSYQGFAYTGKVAKDTRMQFNHITQIRSNTSDEYTKESASGMIGSGITMLSVQYEGIENLDLLSYYYYAPDLYSTFIAQADYKFVIDRENLFCASIQYFNSGNGGEYAQRENRNGGDDIDLVAVKIGYDTDEWMIYLNYSQNFGISGIVQGYGGLANVFTTSMVANGRGNYMPQTWMLKTRYYLPFTQLGQSEIAFTYTNTRTQDSRGDDFDAYYAHWLHRFNTDALLQVRFENIDHKNDQNDVNHLRIIVAYQF